MSVPENDEALRVNLDLVNELRETAAWKITQYQKRIARYYNARVKSRVLTQGIWSSETRTSLGERTIKASSWPNGKDHIEFVELSGRAPTNWRLWKEKESPEAEALLI